MSSSTRNRQFLPVSKSFALALTLVLASHPPAFGGGVVSPCNETGLRAAMLGGGTVTFSCDGTITLSNTIVVPSDTILDASGHTVTISGNNAVRVFQVSPGVHFTLMNLVISSGRTNQGAGIYNEGFLDASNCIFSSNRAAGGGSARAGAGGAIYNLGSLTLSACAFNNNNATGAAATTGLSADMGMGGAIYGNGPVAMTNCVFNGNSAVGGAGLYPSGSAEGYGGAICNQTGGITASNCNFFSNNAVSGTTLGPRTHNYRAFAAGGAIYNDSAALAITTATFANNGAGGAPAAGGAIYHLSGNLILARVAMLGNNATGDRLHTSYLSDGGIGSGGGLFNAGTATALDCTFSTNKVSGGAGEISSGVPGIANGGAARGGGVYNQGIINLANCTIAGNIGTGGTGRANMPQGGGGGAAYGGGAFNNGGQAVLMNCTIVGNTITGGAGALDRGAGGSAYGGGFCNTNGSSAITNCTFLANRVFGGAGAYGSPTPGTNGTGSGGNIAGLNAIQLINTILAAGVSNNASGSITDLGHNLSSDSSGGFGSTSITNTNPLLGPWGNYGGPTLTFPLLAGSPALDTADNSGAPATDQRGHPRPYGISADIGAYESSPPYVVLGRFTGIGPSDSLFLTLDGASNTNIASGASYRLDNLSAGGHTLTAASTAQFVVAPNPVNLSLGPDVFNLDFASYQWNTVNLASPSNGAAHLVYAGTNGQTHRLFASSNLTTWFPIATNTIPPANYYEVFDTGSIGQPARFYRSVSP